MILTAPTAEFTPHPEGIWPAVCVDVIDLGPRQVEYMGNLKTVQKVRIVFETENTGEPKHLARSFTASLYQRSKLAEFLGKWRGRPVVPGDTIDLSKLIGASCTLVVSHQQKNDGSGVFASIDAVSRPTRKVTPTGKYDPVAARAALARNAAQMPQVPRPPQAAAQPVPAAPVAPDTDDVPF